MALFKPVKLLYRKTFIPFLQVFTFTSPSKSVKLLDRCKVAPLPGSIAPTITAFPLTFFDILWLPLPPVEFLFFYEFPYPISHFTHTILPRLKHSLSSTLTHFYPLSGNLSWPHESNNPMICYIEGDSVSFTIVESDADFYHLSSDHLKEATESRPLLPHLPVSGPIVPMLAIQVTIFSNIGICIGLTFHHAICDGCGFTHFMRTWASKFMLGGAASLSPDHESLPFLDRTVIKEPNGIRKKYLEEMERFMGCESKTGNRRLRVMDMELQPNIVRATFQINETIGRRLKDWVFAQYKKDDQQSSIFPPSRFVAICAYTWICLLKAEAQASVTKTNKVTRFVVTMECRARLDPPIPETYFGNCIRPCVVIAEKSDLMVRGVAVAAQLIRAAVREMNKGILRGVENNVSDLLELQSGRILAASGSPQLGFYKTDFGFGRPKKIEMPSIDVTGAMFLKDSSDVDGWLEFDLALSRQEMDAFVPMFFDGLNALTDEHSLWPSSSAPLGIGKKSSQVLE